jgi:hypothetical protein
MPMKSNALCRKAVRVIRAKRGFYQSREIFTKAFCDEVDTGSSEQNASNQNF